MKERSRLASVPNIDHARLATGDGLWTPGDQFMTGYVAEQGFMTEIEGSVRIDGPEGLADQVIGVAHESPVGALTKEPADLVMGIFDILTGIDDRVLPVGAQLDITIGAVALSGRGVKRRLASTFHAVRKRLGAADFDVLGDWPDSRRDSEFTLLVTSKDSREHAVNVTGVRWPASSSEGTRFSRTVIRGRVESASWDNSLSSLGPRDADDSWDGGPLSS